MITLVIGGAASGKSEYAERLACALPAPRYYVATMLNDGAESRARIARHREKRAGRQFVTLERGVDLAALRLPCKGAVLLECLGNWAANERYAPGGAGEDALRAILTGAQALAAQSTALIVVSNEVCSAGSSYAGDTGAYLRLLAQANRALAQRADNVCEVVCGIPCYYKGEEPRLW